MSAVLLAALVTGCSASSPAAPEHASRSLLPAVTVGNLSVLTKTDPDGICYTLEPAGHIPGRLEGLSLSCDTKLNVDRKVLADRTVLYGEVQSSAARVDLQDGAGRVVASSVVRRNGFLLSVKRLPLDFVLVARTDRGAVVATQPSSEFPPPVPVVVPPSG